MRFQTLATAALASLITLASAPSARAEMLSLSAVGALNVSSVSASNSAATTVYSAGTGFGFGALASMPIMPAFSIELGALYVPRKFSSTSSLVTTDFTLTQLEIPLVFRFTPLPLISFGLGGYLGLGLGNVHTAVGSVKLDNSYEIAGISKTDLGLLASAAFRLPLAPTFGLLVDARYLMGLKNSSTVAPTETKFRDFQLLAGVNFSL